LNGLPYFKWYPADAETDEDYSAMNDTELGFYHRCLNRSWINSGLPADHARLARLLKVSPAYLQKMWTRVGKKFQLSENTGRLVNKRQEDERTKAVSKSEKSANAARKCHANGLRSQNGSSHSAGRQALGGADSGSESDSDFEKFWSFSWRKTGKQPARKAWEKKAKTTEIKAIIQAGVERDGPIYMAREIEHRPHMSTWLNEERYNDEPELPFEKQSKLDAKWETV
jgi:uncharacterized protein YdaU (DUF1376 family)